MKNHSRGWRGNPSQRDARGPRHEQHRRPNEGPRAPEASLEEIWPGYLKDGYFSGRDAAGRPLLFPDFLARSRLDPLVGQMAKSDPPLMMSQARRFFGHCRAIEAKLRGSDRASWESQRAAFLKLDVFIADAFGKKPSKVPQLFYDFIRLNVAAVQTEEDFLEGFLPHFEALLGFGACHLKERERRE